MLQMYTFHFRMNIRFDFEFENSEALLVNISQNLSASGQNKIQICHFLSLFEVWKNQSPEYFAEETKILEIKCRNDKLYSFFIVRYSNATVIV